MPVPVPLQDKLISHPVIKHRGLNDNPYSSDLQSLAHSLPVSPANPPPSFGTREQWINSLPSWRRVKSRRIWEEDVPRHFDKGLTSAENAAVIKGERAQARIPPLGVLLQSISAAPQPSTRMPVFTFGTVDGGWVGSGSDRHIYDAMHEDCLDISAKSQAADYCASSLPLGQTDSPISEDDSPGSIEHDDSSPLGPITPFSQFIDRAVSPRHSHGNVSQAFSHNPYDVDKMSCDQPHEPCHPFGLKLTAQASAAAAAVPEVTTPSASPGYRKLAEPLAEWVVSYVWRVCTTGFSLPPKFSASSHPTGYNTSQPPGHLSASVHSVLLSTLLQPSAVFLALWYIVHLPVYFDATGLDVDGTREAAFRNALFSSQSTAFPMEGQQSAVPFRLIVLGFMLANKWLDDHTFSNKTWQTISNVPVGTLNKLESLALAIFSYDLSVPSTEWNRWLRHVAAYHVSLSSSSRPQPISRPSANPHSIVRKAIDEISEALVRDSDSPQPVFLGLEVRKKEKLDRERMLDIDLDEDGPLREEYIPKRRSGIAPTHFDLPPAGFAGLYSSSHNNAVPSPSKWSPSSDEPILRDRSSNGGHYVAVQPLLPPALPPYHPPHPHYQGYAYDPWHSYVKPAYPFAAQSAAYPPVSYPHAVICVLSLSPSSSPAGTQIDQLSTIQCPLIMTWH
ncbi:hypothetical protein ONZ45_g542 [Pleurotus djamor]|nr:hypothetical protein ONZ45_g542 [Pleurotus djamor]